MKFISFSVMFLVGLMVACSDVEPDTQEVSVHPRSNAGKRVEARNGRLHVRMITDDPVDTRSDLKVIFSGGFKNDDISVRTGSRTLYRDNITTDDRVGLAGETRLSQAFRKIDLIVNQNVSPIEVPSGFKYCIASKVSDTLQLHFTNDEPRFR
ncbi:MAG TPA: hypothetical protein VK147_11940 [Candidatus Didemnitutus sp.]|nr:hypothetical protein [Candidatus Didemnitutus sp.]